MNVENIKRVRDVIAALPPERFDMRWVFVEDGHEADWRTGHTQHANLVKGCNTAACVLGWTLVTLRPKAAVQGVSTGAELLGISDDQADELFTPDRFDEPGRYTHAQAVRVLDRLIETGEVDWAAAQAEDA
jgi:hypothetical protein